MKLVFLDTDTIGPVPNLNLLEQFGQVDYYATTSADQTFDRMKDADIIITSKVVINRDIISRSPNLKLISVAATGTNNIDKVAAEERGIPVINTADYSSNSVAQGTFALLLYLMNQIQYYDTYVKDGSYCKSHIFTHFGPPVHEINGKRFGIIGLGNIGRRIAQIAEVFGAEVVYYSASGQNSQQQYKRLELEEFLKTCDIISINAPLNEYTTKLMNYERISLMKKSAILINAGRGGIVDEADLAKALDEELIAGACIDVFEKEPIDPSNPLLHLKNEKKIVMTPHSIWASLDARIVLVNKVVANIQGFLDGRK